MAKNTFGGTVERNRMAEVVGSDRYPESVSVDLDGKDPEAFEIVEEDDTPEDDRGRPTELDYSLADEEEDLTGLAGKTQQRIKRLKFETHTERRAREQAERERDEAVALLRTRDTEMADLRRRLDSGGTALAASMKAQREAVIADATRQLEAAHADGDSAAIAKATAAISTASAELAQINARMPRQPAEGERREEPRQEQRPAEQQQPQLAPNVARWINHNSGWFNKDQAKTAKAMSIHYDLVASNIRPDSDAYTRELDKRMKQSYPDHQPVDYQPDDDDDRGNRREPRRSYGGEPTGRADERRNQNPNKVTLTSTELALAKKLGITPQAYAIEKRKKERQQGAGA